METGAQTNSAAVRSDDPAKIAKLEADRRHHDELAADHPKRPDMTWRDHLLMLLSFGATVEHCLMVQYLYAAYSLRTDEPDKNRREMIESWRASILAVAKEEMGHLLTVQNLRALLGSTVEIGRDSSPWARQYYPYPFTLEPVSLLSLSCFVYAEAPPLEALETDFSKHKYDLVKDEILPRLQSNFGAEFQTDVHRVGQLYEEIIDLISNRDRIPEEMFDESSYEFQALVGRMGPRLQGPSASTRRRRKSGRPQAETRARGHRANRSHGDPSRCDKGVAGARRTRRGATPAQPVAAG
jgi:hypothetical protein